MHRKSDSFVERSAELDDPIRLPRTSGWRPLPCVARSVSRRAEHAQQGEEPMVPFIDLVSPRKRISLHTAAVRSGSIRGGRSLSALNSRAEVF